MDPTYAGKIENGVVVQAIVGTAAWAVENLGGEWHDSLTKIPVPGVWDETYGFRPLPPYPSWVWNGTGWEPSTPYPDDGADYEWDETTQTWVPINP